MCVKNDELHLSDEYFNSCNVHILDFDQRHSIMCNLIVRRVISSPIQCTIVFYLFCSIHSFEEKRKEFVIVVRLVVIVLEQKQE